jgi:hypothetical protein
MGQNIIPVSLPQPIIIGLLKIKKVIIIFNSINIITYKNKMVEQTYHEMLSTVMFVNADDITRAASMFVNLKINEINSIVITL